MADSKFVPPVVRINEQVAMSRDEFIFLRDYIHDHTGIYLEEHKSVMLQSRLSRRLRTLNLDSYNEYIHYLKKTDEELEEFINALTTNKTEFFREIDHFDIVKQVCLKKFMQSPSYKEKTFFTWSAACSTGEEAYSLGLIFRELMKFSPEFDFRILGSDIDTEVLEKATNGIYDGAVIKSIPPQYIPGNLNKIRKGNKDLYQISDELKEKIKFRQQNLIDQYQTINIKFNLIFLRNVLIYFTPRNIQKVINKLVDHLEVGGHLFIGHSETLNGIKHELKPLGSSVFEKVK